MDEFTKTPRRSGVGVLLLWFAATVVYDFVAIVLSFLIRAFIFHNAYKSDISAMITAMQVFLGAGIVAALCFLLLERNGNALGVIIGLIPLGLLTWWLY